MHFYLGVQIRKVGYRFLVMPQSHSAMFLLRPQKLCGRRKNLYIVVGTQYKPIRYGLHERGGHGRTLNMFKKPWRGRGRMWTQ